MLTPYYEAPGIILYCARAEAVLPTLPDQSVQLVLVDPPYFRVKTEYNGEKIAWDRQWKSEAAYLDWLRGLCKEWRRVLMPNGSLYCFASPGMAWAVEGVIREQFHFLNRITWIKEEGWHKKAEKEELRGYLSNWEAILFAEPWGSDSVASKQAGYETAAHQLHKRVYAPIGEYIRTERTRAGWSQNAVDVAMGYVEKNNPDRGSRLIQHWEEGSSLPTKEAYERLRTLLNNGHGEYLRTEYEELRTEYEELRTEYEELRRPFTLTAQDQYTDVWRFAPVQAAPGKHPCEKPLALLRQILTCSSRPGDRVLDCCAGSCSTLEAAKQCGRKAVGIEMDMQWCQRGVQRLQQESLALRWEAGVQAPAATQGRLW